MVRILLVLSFIFTSQIVQAETVQQMSNQVDKLTKAFGEELDQTDRRAIKRRLKVILEIYEDAGFTLNKSSIVCSGSSVYTKDGKYVVGTSSNEQCLFNVQMNKLGSPYLCSGSSVYTVAGKYITGTSSNEQCHSNLEYASQGVEFLCSGSSFYTGKGKYVVGTSSNAQCEINLKAVSQGSDRICSGSSLYTLEGKYVTGTSSNSQCESQILL